MFHWIDALILIAFIVYVIYCGISNKDKASENLEEYFLAGRTLKGWMAGISMAATQFAADTPLLVTGLIATAGVFSLWRLWIYALSFLLMGFLLAGPWRRANVLTDAELTEIRYGGDTATVLRGVKAVYFGTIFNCTVLAMVLLAATRIAEPFLLWNEWLSADIFNYLMNIVKEIGVPFTANVDYSDHMWILSTNNLISILSIVSVTALYSTTGGLRSVVQTDVVQFAIMMIGTTVYCVVIVWKAGGLAAISDGIKTLAVLPNGMTASQLLAFTPSEAFNISGGVLGVFALQWLIQMNSDGTGYLAQRSMACRSEADAKFAAILFTYLQVFVRSLLWLPIGLGLLVIYTPEIGLTPEIFTAKREATFILGIQQLLPVGLRGLMITAMLAALASTIDTHLNWGAGYWTNDLYKRIFCNKILKKDANPRSLVWVARISNICILIIALFIMAHLQSIQSAWKSSLLIGAAMGIPLLLRWFWWRMNSWGEIASIVVATICVPIFLRMNESGVESLLLIAAISLVVTLLAILIKGPEKQDILVAFYKKVRPLGFWGPIARKHGVIDKKMFWFRLFEMLLCSFSCFALLVGVGTLLIDGTPPSWFPYRIAWSVICIASGLLAIPFWLKSFKDAKQ